MKFKDDISSKYVDKSRQKARSDSESTLAPLSQSTPTAAPASVVMGLQMSDVEDLRGHNFVSDSVITYYFEQLSSADKVILQPPSISELLVNTTDPSEFLEHLCLDNRVMLFPVNNNPEIHRADAGTHWSLLVYENLDPNRGARFVHHDSTMGQVNSSAADRLVGVLRSIVPNAATAPLMRGYTPVQENGYDCAIYVMAVAAAICRWSRRDSAEGDWSEEPTWQSFQLLRLLPLLQQPVLRQCSCAPAPLVLNHASKNKSSSRWTANGAQKERSKKFTGFIKRGIVI
ncbi:hypothetical protein BRADI_4g25494v3 [Brachypodium distachyon]|uniref:Ubiquitin-like protease family profile domain-containing protein n=1 Tax=Brachypodium distachyon TaxID=15368 RepID=A0A0Q3EPJ0_BRADI|nr:hypothetical protein BRADI_4g25494v3 [Brachypodium distachyon]